MKSMRGYEESLYFLGLMCRRLREGLTLGLDPELFQERFLDEIDFIDSVLDRIQVALVEEQHLIQKNEYLHQMVLTRQLFKSLLHEFKRVAMDGTMFTTKEDLFEALGKRNHDKIEEVLELLNTGATEPLSEELITHEEMNILLGDKPGPNH